MGSLRSHLFATGIRRSGGPRNGFRCRGVTGHRIAAADAHRIEVLRIPAAWTNVHIALSADERVQAIGQDAAGRWQYLYRRSLVVRRSHARFDRLIAFGEALPALRRALARDLARPGLPREKVLACAVALLAACFLRPGTEIYTVENGSFGLATLRDRHVAVQGSRIRLDFRGKHGQRQRLVVQSVTLARIVVAMKRLPGDEVFKFKTAGGHVRDMRRTHVNAYIKQVMGQSFSARIFRTWGGSLWCAGALARRVPVASAVRETAALLGNTVVAARRSYIHPDVLRAFARGRTVTASLSRPEALIALRRAGRDRSEQALLVLLRRERAARARSGIAAPGA